MAQIRADRPEWERYIHGSEKLTVCCALWDDPQSIKPYSYDESYVHELKRRVEGNLPVLHDFVCLTDRDIPGVQCIPLDMTTFIPATRFVKLMLFNPNGPLAGKRVLYLDLDCVITDSLDPIVDRSEDLVLWRNPNFGQPGRAFYNTSMILHTVGTRPEFWNKFNFYSMIQMFNETKWGGTDQAWVSYIASRDEAHWTDADGVYGHGRLGDVAPGAGTKLPDNARVVFFPGNRTHRTEEVLEQSKWIQNYAA